MSFTYVNIGKLHHPELNKIICFNMPQDPEVEWLVTAYRGNAIITGHSYLLGMDPLRGKYVST